MNTRSMYAEARPAQRGHGPRYDARRPTYADIGCAKWDAVLAAHGVAAARRGALRRELRRLMQPWGPMPIGERPEHFSIASNDGMPMELSAAWSRTGFETRVYVEPLSSPRTGTLREAAMASARGLGARPEVCLERYLQVEDLFFTGAPAAPPAFWALNALMINGSGGAEHKVYLNPLVGGPQRSAAVLEEAMGRLGLGRAWSAAVRRPCGARLGAPELEPIFLALDLGDPARARVKVYFRHAGADGKALEEWGRPAADFEPGAITRVLGMVVRPGSYVMRKPIVTSFTFLSGMETPASVMLYTPLDPNLPDDATARVRVLSVLRDRRIDPNRYLTTLRALSDRPLSTSHMQTYLGYRGGGHPRVSVYFSTQAYTRRNGPSNWRRWVTRS